MKKSHLLFLIFLVSFEFSVYLSNDMILPALVDVVNDFQEPEDLIPLSLSIFLLGSLSIQLIVGPISDRYGRRKTLFAGGLIVLIGNLLGIIAANMDMFFVARILQGMGPCFIGVAGYACVHELFAEKEAIHVISWMASIALFAPMIGPLLGSFVLLFASWRYIFLTTFFLAFITLIGLWFVMPETLPKNKIVPIKFKTTLANYLELFKNQKYFFGTLSFSFAFGSVIVWIASSPMVLISLFKLNKSQFSIVQIPIFMAFVLGTFALRYLSQLKSSTQCLKIGFVITTISMLVLCFTTFFFPKNLYLLISVFACFNFGYGLFSAPFTRIILDSTNLSKGISSALLYFFFFVVGTIFSGIFPSFYNQTIFSFVLYISIIYLISLMFYFFMEKEKNTSDKLGL
ncbi:Bcr/CflA family efflux MFS transporter [Pigmentibacter ruber]|nr:multidrug effflux MFS transporter [Pigmentibacter ruber]